MTPVLGDVAHLTATSLLFRKVLPFVEHFPDRGSVGIAGDLAAYAASQGRAVTGRAENLRNW